MSASRTVVPETVGWRTAMASLCLLAGVALAGWGTYLHLTIANRVSAGQCDGCSPWHPLFVVAPLVVGLGLLSVSGYVLSRRTG